MIAKNGDDIQGLLAREKIHGLLLNSEANVSWCVDFHAPDSMLLVARDKQFLFTDFRYAADYRRKIRKDVEVIETENGLFQTIISCLDRLKLKTIGFESRHLTFAECQTFHSLSKRRIQWIPLALTLEPLREVKREAEIRKIKKGIAVTQKALGFAKRILKAGKTELEIASELERFIRLNGAQKSAFDMIVASGPNSSYPHASVTGRRLRNGEPVLIDLGVDFEGYKCDLTRTFFLGKINPIVLRIDTIVRLAQQKAIQGIRQGVLINKIDACARNYISENGFGKNFGHALGHGLGLEVHEAPSINKHNKNRLKKDSVFTIEPGIYIPGKYGVRREDIVRVTEAGVEVLSGGNRH
ncbi:MAG: M24 family metallopeptidase [Candidatus Omnitrophota bacterium]